MSKQLTLPDWWPEQESLRVLDAATWNYAKAYDDCMTIINWRATALPITLDDMHSRLLKSGFFTVHGRDKYQRVVIIYRPCEFYRVGTNIETSCQVAIFVLFYIMNHMQREGMSENMIMINDLENAQPWNLPIRSVH